MHATELPQSAARIANDKGDDNMTTQRSKPTRKASNRTSAAATPAAIDKSRHLKLFTWPGP